MNRKDLSYIDNMQDLQEEIRLVKLRIKNSEDDIKERLHQLPSETFKATIGKFVPVFLQNKVTSKSLQFGRILLGLIFSKNSKREGRNKIMGIAKGLGFYAGLKMLFSILKKRKS